MQSAVHQANTIYPSTRPGALHIAALILDAHAESVGIYARNQSPDQCLRRYLTDASEVRARRLKLTELALSPRT
jgi:hypothetical protein